MIEGLSGKVIQKLDAVVQVKDQCAVRCTGKSRNYSEMEEVRYISTHPSPSQLQERFRVPCVFQRNGWGVRRLTTGEILGEIDLPPGPIMEALSRSEEQIKVLLTSFLKLPHVNTLQFELAMGLGIGRTLSPSQNNNGLMNLSPVYKLRDENYFRLNLQSRHMKVVNTDNAEIETVIWNNAAAELFKEVYRDKCHDIIFHHLRNIIDKR